MSKDKKGEDKKGDSLKNEKEIKDTKLENEEIINNDIEEIKKEFDELNNKYLRLLADFDNFRKRTIKEKDDTVKYAYAKVIESLLPTIDNLERALDIKDVKDKNFHEGISMVSNSLKSELFNMGLSKLGEKEEDFDPNFHNAVMVESNKDLKDNTILDVLQHGYKFKDKIIRPAMVKVNKHE